MTISIWRYSHLVLAVSSFLFLAMAAITGIILAVDTTAEHFPIHQEADLDKLKLSTIIPALQRKFEEINEISVGKNQLVILKGLDQEGNDVNAYINPKNGDVQGVPKPQTPFILWVTALHRSLFLHELGRFFVGFTAFILVLITISGFVLVIKRQEGFRHFFDRIVKGNFAQYWHVVLGRLSLIPVLVLALSGTYLSLVRFNIFPERKIQHQISYNGEQKRTIPKSLASFEIFQSLTLADVQQIEFPFSDDPEDYYTLKLQDREVVLDQFSGKILSEIHYPFSSLLTKWSLNLHTGQSNMIWAMVIALASLNILFFIYSGFAVTMKRRSGLVKNKFKAQKSKYIILVGSENGSTMRYAAAMHKQLLSAGHTSYLTELNSYTVFREAEHLIIFTSTHGIGNAPVNANRFISLLKQQQQNQLINVSILGFGSRAYPDFCAFAQELNFALLSQSWTIPFLELHTVNDQSQEEFCQWLKCWSEKALIPLVASREMLNTRPVRLKNLIVLEQSNPVQVDQIFTLKLRFSKKVKYQSGDLLAIYTAADGKERFYSIGKVNNELQLVVKLHLNGLGSGYLKGLQSGASLKARLVKHQAFHFPRQAPMVVMLANGAGIAPFLGMIDENRSNVKIHLYAGFKTSAALAISHVDQLQKAVENGNLNQFHFATSREGQKQRITNLISRDSSFFTHLFQCGGVIMICGSLAMQKDVMEILSAIALETTGLDLNFYQQKGQVLTDCY